MAINKCLSCFSDCCKLEVDINKSEYFALKLILPSGKIKKRSEIFTDKNKAYKGRENQIDEMHGDYHAVILKGHDGFCSLLDKETRKCSIYANRPSVCIDFDNNSTRCEKIRKCIN
jgi:Fe-S-cluster containining protein